MKEFIRDNIDVIVALIASFVWVFTGEWVRQDPYLLGLFRGLIWPPLIYLNIRNAINH